MKYVIFYHPDVSNDFSSDLEHATDKDLRTPIFVHRSLVDGELVTEAALHSDLGPDDEAYLIVVVQRNTKTKQE
jgi:hypothetical protein